MLNFALIGCGRIAKKHAEILSSGHLQAKLAAVCDIVPERAKVFGNTYGAPSFTDMHRMMKEMSGKIDVLSILTPSGLHSRHCIELAPYRKPIIVEKPMALTLQDADAMIRACEDAGTRLFVVKQNRFNSPVLHLRRALESGRFGKLVLGTVRVRWSRTQEYYAQDSWRGTWALDGGVIANQASHHVDLLEWMMGEAKSVFAKGATALAKIETEDTAVVAIQFENGALGTIEATTATRPKDLEGSISILGEKGTAEIGGFAMNEMKVWSFVAPLPEDKTVLTEKNPVPPNVYGFSHLPYLRSVIESIEKNTPASVDGPVDGKEGRKSLELITAIYESMETGKEVLIRSQKGHSKLGR